MGARSTQTYDQDSADGGWGRGRSYPRVQRRIDVATRRRRTRPHLPASPGRNSGHSSDYLHTARSRAGLRGMIAAANCRSLAAELPVCGGRNPVTGQQAAAVRRTPAGQWANGRPGHLVRRVPSLEGEAYDPPMTQHRLAYARYRGNGDRVWPSSSGQSARSRDVSTSQSGPTTGPCSGPVSAEGRLPVRSHGCAGRLLDRAGQSRTIGNSVSWPPPTRQSRPAWPRSPAARSKRPAHRSHNMLLSLARTVGAKGLRARPRVGSTG